MEKLMLGKIGAALAAVAVVAAAAVTGPATTGLATAAEEVSGSPTATESTSPSATPHADVACPITSLTDATASPRLITAGNGPTVAVTFSTATEGCNQPSEPRLMGKVWGDDTYRPVVGFSRNYYARGTNAQGDKVTRLSVKVGPHRQTQYAWTAPSQNLQASAGVIQVHRRIDLTSTGPTFTGRLTPAESAIAVGLAYIDGSGRYRYLNQTVSDAQGNFSVTGRLPRGTFTYVVYTSPRQGLLKGVRSVRLTN